MKRFLQTLILFFSLILLNQKLFAVIAYPYPVEITQPDGTKLTIILKGDENLKWAQTEDGYSIVLNDLGIYEYAVINAIGDLVASGQKVHNVTKRSYKEVDFISNVKKGLAFSEKQVKFVKNSLYIKSSQKPTFSSKGTKNLLCILVGFSDKSFSKSNSDFSSLFNKENYTTDGATGSVKDFYKENSYGQLSLSVTVAGPYVAANNISYYGSNVNNVRGNDANARVLIEEAVTYADGDVDFSNFDNDGDGVVDGIYVIYAGYGEEAGGGANTIWAHAWNINKELDGVKIQDYSCSAELRSNSGAGITRIGVICHEFGHVLGAHDFYDTDYEESGGEFDGTGKWDVMASGSWNNNGATPAHHNPFDKIYVYNWASVITIDQTSFFTLNNAAQFSNSFFRINTTTNNEFFLLENRQKIKFDSHIPGHGLLIYHVDGKHILLYGDKNEINISSHQGLYPVCSNAPSNPSTSPNSYGNINSDLCPYPNTLNITDFNDYTTPNSRSWAGGLTNKPISNIVENSTNKTVSFNVSITTDVSSEKNDSYSLSQNYPNPFDNSTAIDFKLVKPAKTSLVVFNSLGQVIDKIVDEYLFAGDYSYSWSPKNIASGIYFYQLNVDGNKEVKRMVKK